jgi:DNA-binding MarR family transcriptional regulator
MFCQDVSMDDDELITQWGLLVEAFVAAGDVLEADLDRTDQLPMVWFEVLLRLERTPGHRLPMTQLAHDVRLTSGGFTKLADRLAEAGYVQRVPCGEDRRVTWMELTPNGVKVARRSKQNHAKALRTLVGAHITDSDFRLVGSAMRKLRDGLAEG